MGLLQPFLLCRSPTGVSSKAYLFSITSEWRKMLSVTACVHRSCFYYDRKVYSDWFGILSQAKMCLGEDHFPFAKRAFNFQSRSLHSLWGWRRGGEEEEGGETWKDWRKWPVVTDVGAEDGEQEATSLQVTWVYCISNWGTVSRKLHLEKKIDSVWMSNIASSPDPDKNQKQMPVLAVFPGEFL